VFAAVPAALRQAFARRFNQPTIITGGISPTPRATKQRRIRWRLIQVGGIVALIVGVGAAFEVRSSMLQARLLSRIAGGMSYSVRPGPAEKPHFPVAGPYDERLGYTAIPKFVERLGKEGFTVSHQAQPNTELSDFIARGGYAVYREKTQAGLTVLDRDGHTMFSKRYPDSAYRDFTAVPAPVAGTLTFIEDRGLLDARFPAKNPAVDWLRFSAAAATRLTGFTGNGSVSGGASTLATQLEKFRHSPQGRTGSSEEKLRQMATASMRAYMSGPDSTRARQQIITDYLNSTPLGSRPGFGEINGIADGLRVWYGTDFAAANKVLARPDRPANTAETARIYKQVLSLLLAQRRPAFYLKGNLAELDQLANSHLGALRSVGVITADVAAAARKYRLKMLAEAPLPAAPNFTDRKAVDAIRADLLGTLQAPGLYSLDRLDLSVQSTVDQSAQVGVTKKLKSLATPEGVKSMGMVGHNMLAGEDPSKIIYSVVLYERGEDHHAVRVHADSMAAPFDLNGGAKLILGSTAKLRTVATYLNIVYDLHQKYGALSDKELRAVEPEARDPLTAWAINHLTMTGDTSLKGMLAAAMQRRYSASPWEGFYTGGGLHRFGNFNSDDDSGNPTVQIALRQSINLPMVRLMRDVVRYYSSVDETPTGTAADTERTAYLRRFADKEGREFLSRFYAEYAGLAPATAANLLMDHAKSNPRSIAAAYLMLRPKANAAQLGRYINARLENPVSDADAEKLLRDYGPGKFDLTDTAYIAGVHPLELWLANHLQTAPGATRTAVMEASAPVRQDVYQWLFKTRHRSAQDMRIRTLREEDAFKRVLEEWRGQGYPFTRIVPSLATALGSSGDRPDALARLMGIILNEGVDLPVATVERLTFASATPYETQMKYEPRRRPVRVFAPEVAAMLKETLLGVVEEGTAVRIHNAIMDPMQHPVAIGGKTGTGDNRFKTFGDNGTVLDSRSVDRTATFAFFIGDKLFGTITAYVPGPYSEQYTFTSSLVVQLLKSLSPEVQKLMRETPPAMIAVGAELKSASVRNDEPALR